MATRRTSEFTQDSEVGRLGLSALASSGFCGPSCDLSDLKVRVDTTKGSPRVFTVNFYDMSTTVSPGNEYYKKLKAAMGALAA